MRIIATILLAIPAITAAAFVPMQKAAFYRSDTKLDMVSRRDAFLTVGAAIIAAPTIAQAQSPQGATNPSVNSLSIISPEVNFEPSQQATGGKIDLNAATVGEYKQFPGMYPTAAGKIASNGPYNSVKDIYRLKNLSDNDMKVFKKYESEFTVNPPGRMFDERINARVST